MTGIFTTYAIMSMSIVIYLIYCAYGHDAKYLFRRKSKMKLSSFRDDNIYFSIMIVPSKDSELCVECEDFFDSYKSAIKFIKSKRNISGGFINKRANDPDSIIIINMVQLSDKRISKPNHILHFCSSASFVLDKNTLKPVKSTFGFRCIFDHNMPSAVMPGIDNYDLSFNFNGDIIDYLTYTCPDQELAQFLLNCKDIITL